jgi:hypothetical protein
VPYQLRGLKSSPLDGSAYTAQFGETSNPTGRRSSWSRH